MRRLTALFALFLTGCIVVATLDPPKAPPSRPGASVAALPEPAKTAPVPKTLSFDIHIADVGTGLAIVVWGEDFTLVYDAGSNDDTAVGARNRFMAYLRAVKPDLTKIDHVILSHPHRDHVELLADVISGYKVLNVWDSGAINPICGYRRFIEAISRSPGIQYHFGKVAEGEVRFDFGRELCPPARLPQVAVVKVASRIVEGAPIPLGKRAQMTFLHVDGEQHGDRYNENSLVAVLDLEGTRALFMGDAEAGGRESPSRAPTRRSVEGHVLSRYRAQLDADIFIAGHHGSKSSSRAALIQAVTPKVCIISAGPTQYQSVTLPDPEIVDELTHAGQVLRTDVDDAACSKNPGKIGPDADDNPGGCDNIQVQIRAGKVTAGYARLSD
jgi:beta-lactamase superfamily II metal-dependent hydrolase